MLNCHLVKKLIFATLLGLPLISFAERISSIGNGFWADDIWTNPNRPFHFYGREKDHEDDNDAKDKYSMDLSLESIDSIDTLQREVKERLNRAVMKPTRNNITSYLQANAFLMEKSGRFSAMWRDTLLQNPKYDWTATHPTVNSVSTAISRESENNILNRLPNLADSWGLIFFGDESRITQLALPLVKKFAQMYGFELVLVSIRENNALMPNAKKDSGQAKLVGENGLKVFPSLVLVNRDDLSLADARIVATGAVDVIEMGRRVVRLSEQHILGQRK